MWDLCFENLTSSHSYKHRHYLNRPCHQTLCSVLSDSECKCQTVLILSTPALIIMEMMETVSTLCHLHPPTLWRTNLPEDPVSPPAVDPAAGPCHVRISPRVQVTRVSRALSACLAPWGRDTHCPDTAVAASRQFATQVQEGLVQTLWSLGKNSKKEFWYLNKLLVGDSFITNSPVWRR